MGIEAAAEGRIHLVSNTVKIAMHALPETAISCTSCQASCCRLEVMLLTDTGVPERYIETDRWGGEVMARLDDGWCAALDRNSLRCSIYAQRPLLCREFEMGAYDCRAEREANPHQSPK